MSADLVLASSGEGWMGTFALTVRFAVDDILSDGAPFEARITHELDDGTLYTGDYRVASVTENPGSLTTVEKYVIPLDAILRLEA